MVYIRGHALDYDRWELSEGCPSWSYANVLPYFKKAQTHEKGENDYRGGSGPLRVRQMEAENPLFRAFMKATGEAGYPLTTDMNGYQQEGFGQMDLTISQGKRWSASTAYLSSSVLSRPNLSIRTGCLTSRILFEGKRATGVQYLDSSKQPVSVYVDSTTTTTKSGGRGVILSGGAINSPQLLMLSGVGDGDHLQQVGIPVHHHLPGVGKNLQDHLEFYLQYKSLQPVTLFSATKLHNMARIGAEWFLFKTGQGSSSHLEAGGFIRSAPAVPHPDIQFHFLPSVVTDHGRIAPTCHSFQAHVGTMRATSKGTIKLQSANPEVPPILDPQYLTTKEDEQDLMRSLVLAREIFAQKSLDAFRGEELLPGPLVDSSSPSQMSQFIRTHSDSAYHPSCTCKMGPSSDPLAVVDHNARVHGLEDLWIVDASIMPSIVSGNLNGPVIMMAEKLADSVRGRPPLPPASVPVFSPSNWQNFQR
jgi:choline dehydrogenase